VSRAQTGAIVIGRDYGALGVVRSLGRHDIPVWLFEEAPSNAFVSRYLDRRLRWPKFENEQLALFQRLGEARDLDGWTIFATSDESASFVARHHQMLGQTFLLTTSPWEITRWAYDKRLTYELAEKLGIDAPKTLCPRDRSELERLQWTFPLIIKPAIKHDSNALCVAKAWRVDNRGQLLRRYDEACKQAEPATILVQELIPGGGEAQFSFAALCEAGKPIASLTARRTRQFPIQFGKYSTFVESIDCPEIEEPSLRLLDAMQYDGLVEVEYKRDPRTGTLKLLDINGRIWAWHTLGARAGVDFTYLQWRLAHGRSITKSKGRVGVRWMRALTDLFAAVGYMRAGELTPSGYLRSFRPAIEFAIFALDDPLPWVGDVPLMAARRWRTQRNAATRPFSSQA
jgi:D-aspartate ligase